MGRVIVLGSLNVDLEVHVPAMPSSGEKVMGDRLMRFAGGKGGNQAVAARATGADVIMVGSVGDDDAGRQYLNRLAALDVGLEVARQPGTPTGHALILTDPSGANRIVVIQAANLHIEYRPLRPLGKLDPARDLFLTQTEIAPDTLSDAVRYVTERGVRAIINVSPYVDLPDDVIAAADPMIIHQADVSLLEATGAKPKSLLVTRGKAGITWDGVDYSGEMVPDPEVVDTIGAGDAFVGTLAGALAQGRDRRAAVTQALAAAVVTVRRYGAQANPRL